MSAAETILSHLQTVEAERQRRERDPALAARVQQIKAYQQRRFADTYADLLASTRHAAAARFFLDELYGPGDFSRRDAQFARVIPALVRLFPDDVIATVETLGRLHALTEVLDGEMAAEAGQPVPLDAAAYARAWQRTGRAADREQQIALMLSVGDALDRFTRKPMLRASLKMMRGPAAAAGLGDLQRFLESGFDTFRAMGGASEFLALIGGRERAFVERLFTAAPGDTAALRGVQLP